MSVYPQHRLEDPMTTINHREIITVIVNTLCQNSVQYEAFVYLSTHLRSHEVPVTNNAVQKRV